MGGVKTTPQKTRFRSVNLLSSLLLVSASLDCFSLRLIALHWLKAQGPTRLRFTFIPHCTRIPPFTSSPSSSSLWSPCCSYCPTPSTSTMWWTNALRTSAEDLGTLAENEPPTDSKCLLMDPEVCAGSHHGQRKTTYKGVRYAIVNATSLEERIRSSLWVTAVMKTGQITDRDKLGCCHGTSPQLSPRVTVQSGRVAWTNRLGRRRKFEPCNLRRRAGRDLHIHLISQGRGALNVSRSEHRIVFTKRRACLQLFIA